VTGLVCAGLVLGCAGTPWPDELGVPVALAQADNVQAGDAFLDALTARRRSANLAAPIVTPRYQADMRVIAEDLQAGKTSAAGARQAAESWGRAAYGQAVQSFVVDCGAPKGPEPPQRLVEMPSAVISYAAAHFRPRSMQRDQCAVLVVALVGAAAPVQQQSL
jgi:hypothetical protein